MLVIGLPPLSPRTLPVNVTMAPMSVRPRVRRLISAPTSKSSACTRTAIGSPSRHGWEECDLARTGNAGGRFDVGPVESHADHLGPRKRLRIFGTAIAEPSHQLLGGLDSCRHVERLLDLADLLAHPGEVQNLDGHGHRVWRLAVHGRAHGRLQVVEAGPQ